MYKIIRFYRDGRKRTIDSNLTLEEAKKHCSDPSTRGVTKSGVQWFDGFTDK